MFFVASHGRQDLELRTTPLKIRSLEKSLPDGRGSVTRRDSYRAATVRERLPREFSSPLVGRRPIGTPLKTLFVVGRNPCSAQVPRTRRPGGRPRARAPALHVFITFGGPQAHGDSLTVAVGFKKPSWKLRPLTSFHFAAQARSQGSSSP